MSEQVDFGAMQTRRRPLRYIVLVATTLAGVAVAPDRMGIAAAASATSSHGTGCLPAGAGYLRARIRGALNVDIDWRNTDLECDGGERPDRSGIRLSFAGRLPSNGQRVRLVFGVAAREGSAGSALPTNLTVIFEGEKRLFATLGDDKCTIDRLQQERLGDGQGPARTYRIVARGFCTEPVTALSGAERIVISRFDFAGRVAFGNAADVRPGAL
jgi:hypothetical protein